MRGTVPVEVSTILAAQVEQVLEALRRDERRAAPRRSRSAFVATVVPCVNRSSRTRRRPDRRAAASTDSSCAAAVGTFAVAHLGRP